MRIVNREGFMEMPEGTFYCKGGQWTFSELCVKGETLRNADGTSTDWEYARFNWVEAKDSGEAYDRQDEMLAKGTSYPMDGSYGRDGMYEKYDLFLVFEYADLASLRDLITETMQRIEHSERER